MFFCFVVSAQNYNPVSWTTSVKKISSTESVLIVTAKINENWHLYSQSIMEEGPMPTMFFFESNKNYLKFGKTKERKSLSSLDNFFNVNTKKLEGKVFFRQRIKIKSKDKFEIIGRVEFMASNGSSCLPPKSVDLVFKVNEIKSTIN